MDLKLSATSIFDENLSFKEKALWIFEHQKENNPVYSRFCKALGVDSVSRIGEIPLLPIQAFKDAEVITASENSTFNIQYVTFFESSGTSGMQRSRHYLPDPELYRQSILEGIRGFYDLEEYVIWAYAPAYQDNPHSSLVWMLNVLIEQDESGEGRFLEIGKPLDEEAMLKIQDSGKKVMLFGAAFGLLDLLEQRTYDLPKNTIIVETGGMKTHRRAMSREELHQRMADGFLLHPKNIHSEYGMSELLSQAYSLGHDAFECVPWMQVSIRNPQNPQEEMPYGEEGQIGIIDLANIHSCSFILTGDKGIQNEHGKFQVMGRWNPTNLRGCNFLIDQD